MSHSPSVLRPILTGSVIALVFLLLHSPVSAQTTGTVQGRVYESQTGQPLSSAQIEIVGTGIGGLSNAQGRFLLLNVPAGDQTVRVTLIGYSTTQQSVTVAPGASATVDLGMSQTALQLDAIVVTGTGRPTERRRLSADVEVMSSAEIQTSAAGSVTELLQGQIPGANISAVSAQPGGAGLMSLRGPTGAMSATTPVIYIDGVRVDSKSGIGSNFGGEQTSALADLAVADIERIEVTKGGAASTLYGADAATGVIQIFTKRGSAGGSQVVARMEQGIDMPETKFIQDVDFVYPEEKFPHLREHPSWDPNFVKNTILKDGRFQAYYLSATGGTQTLGYNLSGRIQDSEGVQHDNGSTMYSLHAGMQAELTDKLNAEFTGSYLRHAFSRLPNGTTTTGALTNIEVGDFFAFSGQDNLADALDVYYRQNIDESVDRFTLSTAFSYAPATFFDARAVVGLDKRVSSQRHIVDIDMIASDDHGSISLNNRDFTGLTLDLRGTFTYQVPLFTSTSTSVGFQGFRESERVNSMDGVDLALPGVTEFDAAALITASEGQSDVYNGGIFLLQQAGIADRLFLEAGVRFDGNTAFGSDVSYQAYPKVGASYDLGSSGFMPDWIGTLRLRGNYGATGKFPPPFLRDRTFEASPFRGESAPRFDNPGNPNLNPERVSTIEGGVDVSLLQNRVGLSLTAYHATTTDALFLVNEQPSTGQTSQLRNVGKILNEGIEASADLRIISTPTIGWNVGITYGALRNEVLDMGGVPPFELTTSGRREYGRIQEGYPLGVRYSNYPVDTNGDGLFDGTERGIVLHPETGEPMTPYPTSNGSVNTGVDFPSLGLSFSGLANWSRGSTVQDYAIVWSWLNGIRRGSFPARYNLDGSPRGTFPYLQAMNYILLKGDYFKLRELTMRYELPTGLANRIGGDRVSLSLSARNVYTWVASPQSIFAPDDSQPIMVDPELHGFADPSSSDLQLGGSQSVALPPPHSLRFAVEMVF